MPTVVDPKDLPKTTSGKINMTIAIIRKIVLSLVAGVILLIGLGFGVGTGYFTAVIKKQPVPTYASVKYQMENVDQSTSLYFADGQKIDRVPTDVHRTKVASQNMSPYLKKAIVATEDENFYQHHGVVPKSVIRAVTSELTGTGTQTGGSTLTQQLVKMQLLSSETTWKRKATEMLLATKMEKHFTKDQILTSYLNVAPFGRNNKGQNIGGVEEAAQGIFGKSAKDLTLPQAAFIAGMPQSPSVYTPYDEDGRLKSSFTMGMKRKDVVLYRMYRNGDITKAQYNKANATDVSKQFIDHEPTPTPTIRYKYLYTLLTGQLRYQLMKQMAKDDGLKYSDILKDKDMYQVYYQKADTKMREHDYRIHSTINKGVYDNMQDAMKKNSNSLGETHNDTAKDPNTGKTIDVKQPVQNGSVLINNKDGAVLGFVGGQNFKDSQLNHAFDTRRSPGSSIKPFLVYAPAIEKGLIGSKSTIADFKTKFGHYAPTDYGKTVANKFVPADEALEKSLNIPAVHLYQELARNYNVSGYMNKMGLKLSPAEYKELGISLGGTRNGFTVDQEAGAFATFANNGVYQKPYYISSITDGNGDVLQEHHSKKTRVFQPGTSYIMKSMMKNVVKKGTASSLTYQLKFNYKNTYGKTGTSNDFRDNWFLGSTPGVTLASWIGYDNLYGHNYDLPENSTEYNQTLWADLINGANDADPDLIQADKTTSRPATVKKQRVVADTGTKPGTVTYNDSDSKINSHMTTSLFYKGSAKPLSKNFAVGGSNKNYKMFWDHYFGKDNNYGVTQYLDSNNKPQAQDSTADTNGIKENKKSDSINGNYSQSVSKNDSGSSTNNAESDNQQTQTTTGANAPRKPDQKKTDQQQSNDNNANAADTNKTNNAANTNSTGSNDNNGDNGGNQQ